MPRVIYWLERAPGTCWMGCEVRVLCTLTESMQQTPWEAHKSSTNQEVSRVLWNPTIHNRVHNSWLFFMSWASWIELTPSHPISLISLLILPFHICLGLPSALFSSGPPTKTLYVFMFFPRTCYMPHPSYPSWLDHPNSMWRPVHIMNILYKPFSHVSCYFPLPGWDILFDIQRTVHRDIFL